MFTSILLKLDEEIMCVCEALAVGFSHEAVLLMQDIWHIFQLPLSAEYPWLHARPISLYTSSLNRHAMFSCRENIYVLTLTHWIYNNPNP